MAKRRKTRTHVPVASSNARDGKPKSFVIKAGGGGEVGSSVGMLVKDIRKVLEPNTASKLKERKSNRLRDFLAMAGPLGVTHLLIFSQTAPTSTKDDAETTVNLRICRAPRGPTLTFKVLRYSLAADVLSASKRPRSPGQEFTTDPLLVLNNFAADSEDHTVALMTTTFQNLFPSIQVHAMPLSAARRVVLISYDPVTRTLDFRHYLITVRPIGVSKAVRKIISGSRGSRSASVASSAGSRSRTKSIPNLSTAQDVADYVLSNGATYLTSDSEGESDYGGADSEVEGEGATGRVELPQDYVGRGNRRSERRAVRVTELGPRMELGLVKIEEGIGNGEVLFHEFVKKSRTEVEKLRGTAKAKQRLAAERRKVQEANVARKQAERDAAKAAKAAKKVAKEQGHSVDGAEDEDEDASQNEGGVDGNGEGEGDGEGQESDLDDDEVEHMVFGDEDEAEAPDALDEEMSNWSDSEDEGRAEQRGDVEDESPDEDVAPPPPAKRSKGAPGSKAKASRPMPPKRKKAR